MMWDVVGISFLAAFHNPVKAFFRSGPIVRNPTALALIIAWLAAEIVILRTGDSLPINFYFMADIAVVAVIYAKANRRNEYAAMGGQLRRMVTDLTVCDRWIVAIYLLGAWPAYVLQFDPWWKWHLLWALAIAQFMLAGCEALAVHIARRRARTETPIIDRHLVVIPFPVQRRVADAVRKPSSDDLLIAKARGHG